MNTTTLTAIKNLDDLLANYKNVAIAFSGGVDSSLLLARAKKILKNNVTAITVSSELTTELELENAKNIANTLTVKHIIAQVSVLKNVFFVTNDKNRCYHCKKVVFSTLLNICNDLHTSVLLDGSNLDDDSDFRPGKKALQEFSVLSPLQIAGFTKQMVRDAAYAEKLPNWNLASNSCAATRISYGQVITENLLAKIKLSESILLDKGYTNVRLRVHGELVRIEVHEQQVAKLLQDRKEIITLLQDLGFKWITLDLNGYKLGSMN